MFHCIFLEWFIRPRCCFSFFLFFFPPFSEFPMLNIVATRYVKGFPDSEVFWLLCWGWCEFDFSLILLVQSNCYLFFPSITLSDPFLYLNYIICPSRLTIDLESSFSSLTHMSSWATEIQVEGYHPFPLTKKEKRDWTLLSQEFPPICVVQSTFRGPWEFVCALWVGKGRLLCYLKR